MISRKYASDYSVGYEPGRGGRLRPVAAYAGAYYGFAAAPETMRRAKRRMLALCAAGVVTLGLLLWFTTLLHPEYRFLALPMAFDLPVLVLTCIGVWRVWTAGERFIRERRDRIGNRLPPAMLFFMILSVLSFAATVVQLAVGGFTLANLLYALDALALAAASVLLFRQRGALKTVQL